MADYIVWSDAYSVGYGELDQQHQTIIRMINDMFRIAEGGWSDQKLADVLDLLKEYTETHFMYEEKIMRLAEFPDLKKHAELHRRLREKTSGLCNPYMLARMRPDPCDVFAFLKDWWIGHIRDADARYAPYTGKLGKTAK